MDRHVEALPPGQLRTGRTRQVQALHSPAAAAVTGCGIPMDGGAMRTW